MTVYEILRAVAATTKKKEKESILMEHKNDDVLKEVFRLAYSPTINFYMKQIPTGWEHKDRMGTSWLSVFTTLEGLSSRTFTGNEAKTYIKEALNVMDCLVANVVCRILQGDLRCGVGANTANKIWKGLIVKPPRKGAVSMSKKALDKIVYPAALELKSDGSYASTVCGGNITMMSRNGNPLNGLTHIEKALSEGFEGYALEGELVFDTTKATREYGNGIITKVVKGTATPEECENVIYQVWDIIDLKHYHTKGEWKKDNTFRRSLLEDKLSFLGTDCIQLIERTVVNSFEEANAKFQYYVDNKFEGAILKQLHTSWKDNGKPVDCVKMKRKYPADLVVVGLYEGEGKAVGTLGGVNLESSCGSIKVNCGSGFSDEQRKEFFTEDFIGSVLELEYDSVTEDKKTKQKSLFLPIFKHVRYDKDEANDLEQILAGQKLKKV